MKMRIINTYPIILLMRYVLIMHFNIKIGICITIYYYAACYVCNKFLIHTATCFVDSIRNSLLQTTK